MFEMFFIKTFQYAGVYVILLHTSPKIQAMNHKLYSLFLFLLLAQLVQGQNLVPNGDFEQYDTCQTSSGQLYRARYWMNPISPIASSSPDYFNACNVYPFFSVPSNVSGYEIAHSGVAYSAICTGAKSGFIGNANANFREYLEVGLLDSLVAGTNYCFQFYVSACDSMNYVSNNIGIFFSPVVIHDFCPMGGCNLNHTPQVENPLANNLNAHLGWTKISGGYIALGGEKYIVIGNYRDSLNTNMVYTGWSSDMHNSFAVYYVDDVSLVKCDTLSSIVGNKSDFSLKVYPNPSGGVYYIELKDDIVANINIFDALGNLVYQKTGFRNKDSPINISSSADGIYLLKISADISFYQIKLIKN